MKAYHKIDRSVSTKDKLHVPSWAEALPLIHILHVTKKNLMLIYCFSKVTWCALLDLALQTQPQSQHSENDAESL